MAIASTNWLLNFSSNTRIGQLPPRTGAGYIWQTPLNGQKDDASSTLLTSQGSASGALSGEGYSPYLSGSGLSNVSGIPDTAVINGLIVRVKRSAIVSGPPPYDYGTGTPGVAVTDDTVRLSYLGTFIGDNKAKTSTADRWAYNTAGRFDSFGGETDTWNVGGLGLTAWLIKQSGFGISLSAYSTITGFPGGGQPGYSSLTGVDAVEFTVFYSLPQINPNPIATAETSGSQRLKATFDIFEKPISTQETFSVSSLYARKNLPAISISSNENLTRQTLYSNANIKPISISTQEAFTRSKILQYIKPISLSSQEVFGNNTRVKPTNNIYPLTIISFENFNKPTLYNNKNLNLTSINSVENFGVIKATTIAYIYPATISSQEVLNVQKITTTARIRPVVISTAETFSIPNLGKFGNISPIAIPTQENVNQPSLKPRFNVRPLTIGSSETIPVPKETTSKSILPLNISTNETIPSTHKFTNRFYDTLDPYNVWTYGDSSSFTWDQTYSIYNGGYSIRRTGTSGFRAVAYPLPYDKGPMAFDNSYDFYYAGYIYLTTSTDSAGLGFGLGNNNDVANGYFALINPRNGTGGANNNSFRLVRVTGGVSRTQTTLASYNLNGLIQANQWYRIIITWSNTTITARLYNKNGTALVNAATLTSTDTTYSSGFYGLAAFDGAVFDHLTNIPAKFIDLPSLGIGSQETFSKPTLVPGNVNILPLSISSQETFGTNLQVKTSYNIRPITLASFETLNTPTLSPGNVNILPVSISSQEVFSSNIILLKSSGPSQEIYPLPIQPSQETFGLLSVAAGNWNIYPNAITTSETLPVPRFNFNIRPETITTLENFGTLKVTTSLNIYPKTITSLEAFGNTLQLTSLKNIYPISVNSQETFNVHNVKSSTNIYPVSISSTEIFASPVLFGTKNVYPKSITTQEQFGTNLRVSTNTYNIYPLTFNNNEEFGTLRVNSRAYIYPKTLETLETFIKPSFGNIQNIYPVHIASQETFNVHQVKVGNTNIYPLSITSLEEFSIPTLYSIAYIYPKPVDSVETFNIPTLYNQLFIYPLPFDNDEDFGIHQIKTNAYIYPVQIDSQEIFGNNLKVSFGNNIYPLPFDNDEEFGIPKLKPVEFIYPVQIDSQEIFGNNLKVSFGNNIYPLPFDNDEEFGLHNLFPGEVFIYPVPLNSEEIVNGTLRLFAQDIPPARFIWPNTSDPNLPGYNSLSEESFGVLKLDAQAWISPINITSQEIFGVLRFTKQGDIYVENGPTSQENFGLHTVRPGEKNIYPMPFDNDEQIGTTKLYINYNIYPKTFDNYEEVGGTRTRFELVPLSQDILENILGVLPPEFNPLTDFYLSNDNQTIFTWDPNILTDFDIYINDEVLTTGYSLDPYNGFLNLSLPIEEGDLLTFKLYTKKINVHNLFAQAYIYPIPIDSEEVCGYHRLKPTSYPGTIHSWFEILHNIESSLNFRGKSL